MDDIPPYVRNVGMIFQNYALYPHMTVYDNLAFGLSAQKVPKKDIRFRVGQVAELLELQHLLRVKPSMLSGGQRQRVAVGRALVRRPQVFLMDEPLSNLDALLRERMRVELRKLHEQLRIPTLYVTHDQTEAMTLADRIAVMRGGEVLQVGTPEEVYGKPETVFVAQFLGSPPMNLLRVKLTKRAGVSSVGHSEETLSVPDRINDACLGATDPDGTVWCGFRPESIEKGQPGGGLELHVTVDAVETLGARYYAHGFWGKQPVTLITEDRTGWTRGSVKRVTVPWEQVHWFHGHTHQRIDVSTPHIVMAETGGVL